MDEQGATFDTTAVTDGLYDLRVVTTDNAGNAFTSGVTTVRVDNTLPTGSVTSPAAAADVRGSITLASDSADAGSGVATVQFQRSPIGLGTWTNQAASWNTTLQADGQYDVRVVTTDNAGNVFTSPTITIRVDNTAPTGSVTAPATGAEIGVPPVSLTSDSADAGGSGVDTVVFERSPAGAGTWTATAASWNTASGPDAVADGSYDLRVTTTDKAGNSFTSAVVTVLVDHTAPVTSASLAPGSPSNAPVTVSFTRRRRQRLRRQHHVLPRRRRQPAAGQLGHRQRPGRPLERRQPRRPVLLDRRRRQRRDDEERSTS